MIIDIEEGESFILQPNDKPLRISIGEIYGSSGVRLIVTEVKIKKESETNA